MYELIITEVVMGITYRNMAKHIKSTCHSSEQTAFHYQCALTVRKSKLLICIKLRNHSHCLNSYTVLIRKINVKGNTALPLHMRNSIK